MAVSLTVMLCSCGSVPKDIAYFQGIELLTPEQTASFNQNYSIKISPDDRLLISVTSPFPYHLKAAPYNHTVTELPKSASTKEGESDSEPSAADTPAPYNYTVDRDGNIRMPVLGAVHVAGLSPDEASRLIERMIKPDVPDVLVSVDITGFKAGILGEVKNAGSFEITAGRCSVLDLIAMAGDLTLYGDRKNVLLIRDVEGKKEFARLDLTNPNVFASPYYYLRKNDLVYVEPNAAHKHLSGYTQESAYKPQIVTSLFGTILTTTALVTSSILSYMLLKEELNNNANGN